MKTKSKMLKDGEQREIRPTTIHPYTKERIKVIAHRVDCDTPYVLLKVKMIDDTWVELSFTDYEAQDIALMFIKALEILPTSK